MHHIAFEEGEWLKSVQVYTRPHGTKLWYRKGVTADSLMIGGFRISTNLRDEWPWFKKPPCKHCTSQRALLVPAGRRFVGFFGAAGWLLFGLGLICAPDGVTDAVANKSKGTLSLPRVHASFSSRIPATLLSQVQTSVQRANCCWTATHTAQNEDWFAVWSASARLASCVIVMFTIEYKTRFTPALKKEAELIYELHTKHGMEVYIFDGNLNKPAEVQVNLLEKAPAMGSISEWWRFCCDSSNLFEDRGKETAGIICSNGGHCDLFISHTQRNAEGKLIAAELYATLQGRGISSWLDVKMPDMNTAAMEAGVRNAKCVLAVITGPCVDRDQAEADPMENAYFKRPMCVQELRWAREAGVPILPLIRAEDKKKIGQFITMAPDDLKDLGNTDFIHLDRTRARYWEAGVDEVLDAFRKMTATEQLTLGARQKRGTSFDVHRVKGQPEINRARSWN